MCIRDRLVVIEDIFDAPALGVDLDVGVELLSVVGNHTLDEHLLAFAQVVLLLLGKL